MKRRRPSHRVRHASPTRALASRITKSRCCLARIVTDRQARLSTTDDHRVEPPNSVHVVQPFDARFACDDVRLCGRRTHRLNHPFSAARLRGYFYPGADDEAVLVGPGGCCGAGRHAELVEDVAHVATDGPVADDELVGDRAVRLAGGDEPKHLDLAGREATGWPRGRFVEQSLHPLEVGTRAELSEGVGRGVELQRGRIGVVERSAASPIRTRVRAAS